jgi:hypothetical protein
MKRVLIFLAIVFVFTASASALLVAGFNNGDPFGYGIWTSNPKDKALVINGVKDPSDKIGKAGASYRIIYNVKSSKPGYVGLWIDLSRVKLRNFSTLSFWIKGDKKLGYPKNVAVIFKGGSRMVPVTSDWRKVEINLKDLGKEGEQELDFIIDNGWADVKSGAILIDEIELK